MHNIALLLGDGIGPEIVNAAVQVIEATGVGIQWHKLEGGNGTLQRTGTQLPDETLETYLELGVGFKGPFIINPEDPPIIPKIKQGESRKGKSQRRYSGSGMALRNEGGAFAALRTAKSFKGVPSPIQNVDIAVVREITEDIYVVSEYTVNADMAVALKVITRKATEAVVRFAFEYAKSHGRRKVTAIHKAMVLRQTDGLFLNVASEIAREYPEIEFRDQLIDSACAHIINNASMFDVAVLPNQYGDIFSDLCAAAAGSLGLGAGATYGAKASLFEPVHGAAPDIGGKGIANPVSQILSGALMLRHLQENKAADAIEKAVADALLDPSNHTPDLGGGATTERLAKAIIHRL